MSTNISSTTNIINGVAYTQNIVNFDNENNTCSSEIEYCQEGYSLYVPCLKNITRGQNVCFQFYLVDKVNQDVLDINRLCGLTLSLSGLFGCTYGDYTWPENISTLQRNEYTKIKCEDFNCDICNLDLGYIDFDNNQCIEIDKDNVNNGDFNVNIKGLYGNFLKGDTPYLEADDSDTHIFMGWTTSDIIKNLCDNFTINDLIISNKKIWNESIYEDTIIFAVYRKRNIFKIMVDFENRHSYFMVTYGGKTIMLSDKERDYVKVMEGHHFMVKCCPLTTTNKNGEITHIYNFYSWSDGNKNQIREYLVDNKLFTKGIFRLKANCYEDKNSLNILNDINQSEDIFERNLPKLNTLTKTEQSLILNNNIIDFDENKTKLIFDPSNDAISSHILIKKNGYITLESSGNIGTNLNIVLYIDTSNIDFGENMYIPEPETKITIKNGNQEVSIGITSPGDNQLTFEFENCEDTIFDISTDMEELIINKICIYEKHIINKGKIELCIPSNETKKLYRGILNMSGTICVDDNWYTIDTLQIGNITNNKIIEIKKNGE